MGPTISILDVVHCKANKEARTKIRKALAYENSAWVKAKFGKKQKVTTSHLISGRKGTSGIFLTGLLPRIRKHCKKKGIKLKIKDQDNLERFPATNKPFLKGITFRKDQAHALRRARLRQRGGIVAPTGSGKTIVALGIISMFPESRILFLCHTVDLLKQTADELIKFGFNHYLLGGGSKDDIDDIFQEDEVILLSTIQTFSKIQPQVYMSYFDVTIVDEGHHVNAIKSGYGKVMENNLSPRRYFLTATLPTKQDQLLSNEGFFGPVIAELTYDEGIEQGIIAKPIIKLLTIPYDMRLNARCKTYQDYYKKGIVKNTARNNEIVEYCKKVLKKKELVLIIVEKTDHGKLIKAKLERAKIKAPFVYGSTKADVRNRVKKKLQKKRLLIAICSRVWLEGINIKTINHVIFATGMMEEKRVLQGLGRGQRTDDGKDTVTMVDFLDPYPYLSRHSILRLQTYNRKGWL